MHSGGDEEEAHGSRGWLETRCLVADDVRDVPPTSAPLPEWATNPFAKEPGSLLSRLDGMILSNTLICTGAAVAEPLVSRLRQTVAAALLAPPSGL